MSDEPKKEEPDLLAPLATLLGCVLLGAQMPRTTRPGEDLLADGVPELGVEVSAWAPGGRLWLAKAFRDLGDALAAPEEPRRGGANPEAGGDPAPRGPAGGAGLDPAPMGKVRPEPGAPRRPRAGLRRPRPKGV
jgi:hypothetical protein